MVVISCNDRLDVPLVVREIHQYSDGSYRFTIYSYYTSGRIAEEYDFYSKTKEYEIGDTLYLKNE